MELFCCFQVVRLATLTHLVFDRESAEHEKIFRLNDFLVNIPLINTRGGSSNSDIYGVILSVISMIFTVVHKCCDHRCALFAYSFTDGQINVMKPGAP